MNRTPKRENAQNSLTHENKVYIEYPLRSHFVFSVQLTMTAMFFGFVFFHDLG